MIKKLVVVRLKVVYEVLRPLKKIVNLRKMIKRPFSYNEIPYATYELDEFTMFQEICKTVINGSNQYDTFKSIKSPIININNALAELMRNSDSGKNY